jgi:hypothetical protein
MRVLVLTQLREALLEAAFPLFIAAAALIAIAMASHAVFSDPTELAQRTHDAARSAQLAVGA